MFYIIGSHHTVQVYPMSWPLSVCEVTALAKKINKQTIETLYSMVTACINATTLAFTPAFTNIEWQAHQQSAIFV